MTQNQLHVLDDHPEFLRACERLDIAWLCRGPLAMGLLTGKYMRGSKVASDDVRGGWDTTAGAEAVQLERLAELRDLLTKDGRSLARGRAGLGARQKLINAPHSGF